MKRHTSLHPLSQHHHFALVQALQIRRARELPAGKREAALRSAAGKFLRFWKRTGQQHFREEEEVVLAAYAGHVPLENDAEVMRMLADHAAIRALSQRIETALADETDVEADVVALGRRLQAHVRLEENRIFPRIEATLSEAELRALGQRLTRLHPKGACEV
jgi:hemerythrin-like domain-containing protein